MSHYIDTKQAPQGGLGRPSVRQTLEIIVGILVAIALGVAAFAYVNTGEPIASSGTAESATPLTMVNHSALDPFETQFASPRLQAPTTASAAPLTMVTHSALDPFEAQYVSPQLQTAIGATAAPLTMVTHSALDPFETQYVTPQLQTTPLTFVAHDALDPFETQYVSPRGDLGVGAPSQPSEEGSPNPLPEFR